MYMFSIGAEQILVATVCIGVTLYTSDILWGVVFGTVTKLLVLGFDLLRALTFEQQSHSGSEQAFWPRVWAAFQELFRDPVIRIGDGRIPGNHAPMIILAGHVVDHSAMDYLDQFRNHQIKSGHTCVILGTQHFHAHSKHRLAYRVVHSDDALA
jgi:hypothetical protein